MFPFIQSCKDDDDNIGTLKINQKNINFLATGTLSKTVKIDSKSGKWKAVLIEDVNWCQISIDDNGALNISVTENKKRQKRTVKIEVRLGTQKDSITVEQLGTAVDILVDRNFVDIKTIGDVFTLRVTTNAEYKFTIPKWVKEAKPSTRSDDMVDYLIHFSVGPNEEDEKRQGVIEFYDINRTAIQKVIITQKGLNDYSGKDLEGVFDDIKHKVINATASSEHYEEKIDMSHDGNLDTKYTSNWSNTGSNYFPIELIYNLENADALNYFIYYPRNDYSNNGLFKEVEIEALFGDNSDFIKIMDYNFKGSSHPTRVTLDKKITNPKSIKFIVKSGDGDGQGFASCAEMEFYQYNPNLFDYSTLFTDQTCSELKIGITKSDIEECEYSFYQNLAYYLFNNKYDNEFRVATFKAYPHPDIQARINKTGGYSLMDNPTGIYVTEDEEVIILADDLKGAKLSVLIQNLDTPGGDGFGGPSFPISAGVNKFKAPHKGLLYIMYHSNSTDDIDAYKELPPVKLHFATGLVNGYFDSQKHSEEDWNRLIDNTTSQYFDVVGKYSHITFPVNDFKLHTTSGLKLINVYDQIVFKEMELMGLFKYDTPETPRIYRNRMYFNVMYHSYMYAASYRTGYESGTMTYLTNENILPKDGIWGPAHEVGHMNQTSPGLKWVGTTELTNNIFSQYVQTELGNISRLQGEDCGEGTSRFEHAMTNLFYKNDLQHAIEPDVFCKLVPFWQLHVYFSWVLGNNDFYKDVHEDVRQDPDRGTAGKNQLWFAYRASKAAGYDLTDFFEKWGFFRDIDIDMQDYWTERLTITPDLVNDVKKAIKSLNLQKPKHAFEYITDENSRLYKTNEKVINGTFSIDNSRISTRGCENAVAIEVYEGDKLFFIGTRPNFRFPKTLSEPTKARVEAISADGTRVKLTKE